MKPGVLDVLDRAYDLDSPASDWLRNVGTAVYEQLGAGMGILGHYYRVTPEGRLEMGESFSHDMPDGLVDVMRGSFESLPPEFVRKSFVRCECTTQSDAVDAEMKPLVDAMMEGLAATFGWRDVVMLGGMDPTGHAVYLGAWLPRATSLPARVKSTWSRAAVHVATAHRLRRQLAGDEARRPDTADAVLSPDATVAHAVGEAKAAEAREALRRAVRDYDRARGAAGRSAPDEAIADWKGLVSARWSLVEHFESDGRRYLLARRNDVTLAGFDDLTARERQALGYAALGHGNKMIAYEMGIASSTVGVLLHRAARKLGAPTRADLVRTFVEHAGRDADSRGTAPGRNS